MTNRLNKQVHIWVTIGLSLTFLKVSRLQWIDSKVDLGTCSGMDARKNACSWLNVIASIAIAFALAVFPSSASHAMTGLNAEQQLMTADHEVMSHDRQHHVAENNPHICGSQSSGVDGEDHAANGCCSGICVSVTFPSNGEAAGLDVTSEAFVWLEQQPMSFDAPGHLRPPQNLN